MHSASTQPVIASLDNHAWKKELSDSITSLVELYQSLELGDPPPHLLQNDFGFRVLVTRAFLAKIRKGDPEDPLLLQVMPSFLEAAPGGFIDPVGDLNAMPTPGLLHKYHGRVLLISTGACAIHCRYCFRRHFPYAEASSFNINMPGIVDYLRQHPEIEEVILSGGDPLMLDDRKLARIVDQLESIPHVKWLRLHTRLPVVLPSRISPSLLDWMTRSRLIITVVIHSNHANEIGSEEEKALGKLLEHRVHLLNQSVLLKGINDSAESLIALSKRLHHCGVKPYYLHLLDPVQGAMHFEVEKKKAIALIAQLRSQLPGYLVPQLVREEANKPSKTAIFDI